MTDALLSGRVGEVTASHTERVAAQCYRLHAAPPLGALVRIGAPPVYGVVREIWHEPLDPGRPLSRRRYDMKKPPATARTGPRRLD